MAGGYLDVKNILSYTGTFSVLEGVMVKIGDRFQGPSKVTLSMDLKPLKLQEHTFDFSFEEEIVNSLRNEINQEKMIQKQEEVKKDLISDIISKENEYSVRKNHNTENQCNNSTDELHLLKKERNNQSYPSITDAPILEPTPIHRKQIETTKAEGRTSQFNYLEFEDSTATPFELVELQTLDDIDELKSVLQPNSVLRKENKSISSGKNFEQKKSFPVSNNKSSELNDVVKENPNLLLCQAESVNQPQIVSNEEIDNNRCETIFTTADNDNTCTNAKYGSVTSRHHIDIVGKVYADNNLRERHMSQLPYNMLCNSSTNLITTNSKSLPNLVDANFAKCDQGTACSPSNYEDPPVSTSRIDNIMRKFQFIRMSDSDAKTFDPVKETHSIKESRVVGNSMQGIDSSMSQSPQAGYTDTANAAVTIADSSFCKSSFDSVYEEPVKSKAEGTIEGLTFEEWKLVNKLSGMGFPKERTVRAVKRLKNKEKEAIDFLILVQQIADMGYHANDVEIAILSNTPQQVISYLDLVNKWKELGFASQKIHDALHNTDKENETVLEYLTS